MARRVAQAKPIIRAAVYVRISSDDERDELGVRRQEKNCRQLVADRGWASAGVYCDNDRSASKVPAHDHLGRRTYARLDRPAWERLLRDVADNKVDAIVVQNQDRLLRGTEDLEQVMRVLWHAGIDTITTVSAGDVDVRTTNGRTLARVKSVMDIAYSEYISEKVREKKAELLEQGLPTNGGTRPFGYEKDRMTVVPAEAKLIREAAERVIAGEALGAICRDWTGRGVATVTGKPWLPNVIRGMLLSPRIAGLAHTKGEVVGEAKWPAIIDRAAWERVCAALKTRPRAVPAGRQLLTGLVYCGTCGKPMHWAKNNGKRAYRCHRGPGFDGCGNVVMVAEPLEAEIVETVLRRFDRANVEDATKAVPADDTASQLRQLERRKVDLAEAFACGEIDRSQLRAATRRLDENVAKLRAAFEAQATDIVVEPFRSKAGLLRRRWNDTKKPMSHDTRRAVLAGIIKRIEIGPAVRGRNKFDRDRIGIIWRA